MDVKKQGDSVTITVQDAKRIYAQLIKHLVSRYGFTEGVNRATDIMAQRLQGIRLDHRTRLSAEAKGLFIVWFYLAYLAVMFALLAH